MSKVSGLGDDLVDEAVYAELLGLKKIFKNELKRVMDTHGISFQSLQYSSTNQTPISLETLKEIPKCKRGQIRVINTYFITHLEGITKIKNEFEFFKSIENYNNCWRKHFGEDKISNSLISGLVKSFYYFADKGELISNEDILTRYYKQSEDISLFYPLVAIFINVLREWNLGELYESEYSENEKIISSFLRSRSDALMKIGSIIAFKNVRSVGGCEISKKDAIAIGKLIHNEFHVKNILLDILTPDDPSENSLWTFAGSHKKSGKYNEKILIEMPNDFEVSFT